jgi:hypothetical protein
MEWVDRYGPTTAGERGANAADGLRPAGGHWAMAAG